MLEKFFLLSASLLGTFASLTGRLPAVMIALFGDRSVLTMTTPRSASEKNAIAASYNQAELTNFAQVLGSSIGQSMSGSSSSSSSSQTTTPAPRSSIGRATLTGSPV
jgi:hypothetical protein